MKKLILILLSILSSFSFASELEKYECDITSDEYTKVYFEINQSDNWAQFFYLDEDGSVGPGAIATAGLEGDDPSLTLGYIITTTAMGNNIKELLFIFEKIGSYVNLNLYNPFKQGAHEAGKCTQIN